MRRHCQSCAPLKGVSFRCIGFASFALTNNLYLLLPQANDQARKPDASQMVPRVREVFAGRILMIANKIERKPAEAFEKGIVSELVRAAGPCVTLVLPPYRHGASEAPAAQLKTALHDAAKQLAARKFSELVIGDLLEPLRQWSHEEDSLAGSTNARAIFRSAGLLHQFALPVPPPNRRFCTVGDCFWLCPILNSLALPPHVYVLEITKKAVAMLACGFSDVTSVEFPQGTPTTLDQAMEFDAPDHDLKNRSSAGPSVGAMPGVSFGTTSDREKHRARLHDFYRVVDRGVNELLRWNQAPLVLTGVDEDTSIYRSLSTYPDLCDRSIHGSPGAPMTATQVLSEAHRIALDEIQQRASREMAAARERLAPARFSIHLADILQAAVEGRVSDLYLDEQAERPGSFDGKAFGGTVNWLEEDLLNVAAIETLRRGGAVYLLPSQLMMDGSAAAAAFRY
jgi:Bacterial archaeo-eukaryotic release factor family 3